jgi:hypothetical protein|tara:strand:- start:794 stop:2302 length:1509 start_codon:yes stop_codon:yes gene_type:complete
VATYNTGFLDTGPRESELLKALMKMGYKQDRNPQSGQEAFARTASTLVDSLVDKKIFDDEKERAKTSRTADMAALKAYIGGTPEILGTPYSDAPTAQDLMGDPMGMALGGEPLPQELTSQQAMQQQLVEGVGRGFDVDTNVNFMGPDPVGIDNSNIITDAPVYENNQNLNNPFNDFGVPEAVIPDSMVEPMQVGGGLIQKGIDPYSQEALVGAANTEDISPEMLGYLAETGIAERSAKFNPNNRARPVGGGIRSQVGATNPDGTAKLDNAGNQIMETRVVFPTYDPQTGQTNYEISPFTSATLGTEGAAEVKREFKKLEATDKVSVELITEANKQIGSIDKNTATYTDAIRLLQGSGNGKNRANTGIVNSLLPDLFAPTIALGVIRKQLGLDLIGSVTLGAINEKELDLVLATGLPTDMSNDELIDWLQRREAANQKIKGYLSEQIQYLATPNGSIAGWRAIVDKRAAEMLPEGVTEDDLRATMKANGMTRAEVIKKLNDNV